MVWKTTSIDLFPLNKSIEDLWNTFCFNKPEDFSKPPSSLFKIFDDNGGFTGVRLQLALAGFTKEDLEVSSKENVLKIKGTNKKEEINPKFQCEFDWEISLRKDLDLSKMEGSLENGLLSIFVPVKEDKKLQPKILQLT